MNIYIKPTGHQNRLMALESIAQKGTQDGDVGITYLREDTLAQAIDLVSAYTTAMNTVNTAKSVRAETVAAANTAITAVIKHIRDIWVAVKRRTDREELPVAVQVYYGLPLNGRQPQISSQAAWVNRAMQIIQGEAEAVAAGYPALTAPTIAQLQIKLTAAQTAVSQRAAAKTSYNNSRAALRTLSQQVDSLIATAMHELRLVLRTETASSRREIMRGYGARFSEGAEDVLTDVSVSGAGGEEAEKFAAPAVTTLPQPYAVYAGNGNGNENGTAVHV